MALIQHRGWGCVCKRQVDFYESQEQRNPISPHSPSKKPKSGPTKCASAGDSGVKGTAKDPSMHMAAYNPL